VPKDHFQESHEVHDPKRRAGSKVRPGITFPGRVKVGGQRPSVSPETLINAASGGVSCWEGVSLWDGLVPEPVVPVVRQPASDSD